MVSKEPADGCTETDIRQRQKPPYEGLGFRTGHRQRPRGALNEKPGIGIAREE
jgi:hypothetical protein